MSGAYIYIFLYTKLRRRCGGGAVIVIPHYSCINPEILKEKGSHVKDFRPFKHVIKERKHKCEKGEGLKVQKVGIPNGSHKTNFSILSTPSTNTTWYSSQNSCTK